MEASVSNKKAICTQWVTTKKGNYEWLMIIIVSALGFGIVITLITFAELAQLTPK
jgi:hypothetical protein